MTGEERSWQLCQFGPGPCPPRPPADRPAIAFTGVFDGRYHTINGLYIDSEQQDVGLFGAVGVSGIIKTSVLPMLPSKVVAYLSVR